MKTRRHNRGFSRYLLVGILALLSGATAGRATIYLSDDGWSQPVGDWDPDTRTATLTQDLIEGIEIDAGDLILDGNGHTVTGTGTGDGLFAVNRYGLTVTNLAVSRFDTGIRLEACGDSTVSNNTASDNNCGFYLYATGPTISGNTAFRNTEGIYIPWTDSVTLDRNTAFDNTNHGIALANFHNSTLLNSTVHNNGYGIELMASRGSTLRGNIMTGNVYNFEASQGRYAEGGFDNTIETSNLIDGRPIYYVRNASNQVFEALDAGAFYLVNSDNCTVRGLDLHSHNGEGIFFWNTHNSRIENCTVSTNWAGIWLLRSNGNTVVRNTANSNYIGICPEESAGNTVTGNTCSSNGLFGISVYSYCSDNIVVDNVCNSNQLTGITVGSWCTGTLVRGNTCQANVFCGISVGDSTDNDVVGNTCSSNGRGIMIGGVGSTNNDRNTVKNNVCRSNGDLGIHLYTTQNCTVTGNTLELNAAAGIDLYRSNDNTIAGNKACNTNNGISLGESAHNSVTGNTCNSNNCWGIVLGASTENTVTGNTFTSNGAAGIDLYNSADNTLANNRVALNQYGITLAPAGNTDNKIYHNSFIDNTTQAYVEGDDSNLFNLDKPIGGNFWSDWTAPDADHDGFVDSPYVFEGGQDNLPWAQDRGWENRPPTISSISATPSVLWPPNHKMVTVTVAVTAQDPRDPAPVSKIVAVTCNEPIHGPGSADPDWQYGANPLVVSLRADRAGTGAGRVYTLHVTCTDAAGNTAEATTNVTVPHDQGKGK